MDSEPSDNLAYRFPVSIKGVVPQGDKVVLLKNGRDEWELPGGKLELGEPPEECLRREIQEELGISVSIGAILDSWVYRIVQGVDVLIVTYGCSVETGANMTLSNEHKAIGIIAPEEVNGLNMPDGYKRSIAVWFAHRKIQDRSC